MILWKSLNSSLGLRFPCSILSYRDYIKGKAPLKREQKQLWMAAMNANRNKWTNMSSCMNKSNYEMNGTPKIRMKIPFLYTSFLFSRYCHLLLMLNLSNPFHSFPFLYSVPFHGLNHAQGGVQQKATSRQLPVSLLFFLRHSQVDAGPVCPWNTKPSDIIESAICCR